MPLNQTKCLTKDKIIQDGGQVIENSDGSVSVYTIYNNTLTPIVLGETCCLALTPSYVFDIESQKCLWGTKTCSIEDVFKITLNPSGNDGSIFYVGDNEDCTLDVSFDYLFKVKCETLLGILLKSSATGNTQTSGVTNPVIVNLTAQLAQKTVDCQVISNQISILEAQVSATSYSIICESLPQGINPVTASNSTYSGFSQTGFVINPIQNAWQPTSYNQNIAGVTYCLTEPVGLTAWKNILGPLRYQDFLNGDPASYTCSDVNTIVTLNDSAIASSQPPLLEVCQIPFGTKSILVNQLGDLLDQQDTCNTAINNLTNLINQSKLSGATAQTSCDSPISLFELLDVSMSIDVVNPDNTLSSVTTTSVFPAIGLGKMYEYLTLHPDSGFYVATGGTGTGSVVVLGGGGRPVSNQFSCGLTTTNLFESLFKESGLPTGTTGYNTFTESISEDAFASTWLNFSTNITDQTTLDLIKGKQIKLSLIINHTCDDICILLDNIVLNKVCTSVKTTNIFVTQCPGFELDKVIDNKKSWLANSIPVNRIFDIYDVNDNNPIRQTDYDVNDERLVINTKEIDLDVNIASAIETDVWNYINNNPCLLTGVTHCYPCGYKTFQDGEGFDFMDEEVYTFMDVGGEGGCCGDNEIIFTDLMTQPLSAVTTVEGFGYFMSSELIDAKNRQTITSYATLRALYERYLNTRPYCDTLSSAYDYMTMDQFAGLIGNYWVDIVEQVIPSTTIWGSVRIYSNTIFDQQKYKYKAYSSLLCGNSFDGMNVPSPIYCTSGLTETVGIDVTNLNAATNIGLYTNSLVRTTCDSISIAQMNSGSEFIGSVNVIGDASGGLVDCAVTYPDSISECALKVSVQVSGLTATAILVGAIAPVMYEWSNSDINSTTVFSGSGNYNIIVTDSKCCTVTTEFTI